MKTFEDVMDAQLDIQRRHQGIDPDRLSLTERADEIMRQQQYLLDEITEVLTALGGPYGKASWKAWKVVEECADVAIFAMNIISLCGVKPSQLVQVIDRKQKVNLQRWENGY